MRTTEGDPSALSAGDVFTLLVDEPREPHCFIGVEFYSAASCAAGTVATPTTGTLTFEVRPTVIPNSWVALTGQDVDLSVENKPANWTGSPIAVRVSGLSSVSGGGATHYRVRVTCSPF